LLARDGRLSEGAALLERAVARYPDDAEAWADLALLRLQAEGPIEPALEAARRAVALRPQGPLVRAILAEALLAAGHLEEARAEAARAVALDRRGQVTASLAARFNARGEPLPPPATPPAAP